MAAVPSAPSPQDSQPVELPATHTHTGRRSRWRLLGVISLVVVAAIIAEQHGGRTRSAPALPPTPQQWVHQWTAASLTDPARVCRRLFAPALASAFKSDTGRSCMAFYRDVNSKSFRIRRVIEDGGAAAVEARQVGTARDWGYFTVLLSRVGAGWQAIDVVPGGSIRSR